ncbi:DUF887-domain-containing protein, partial [Caulochytrium protostelioides]
MGPYLWLVLSSTIGCQLLYLGSRGFFTRYSVTYQKLSPVKKIDFAIHIVSLVHALFCVIAIVPMFHDPELAKDRLFAWTPYSSSVLSVVCGYFWWDVFMTFRYFRNFGIGFALHAIGCVFVFTSCFRPFLHYFAASTLLFELSTPFLNIHYFCDKLGYTGSRLQLVNGILLLVTFFAARLVNGPILTYSFVRECWLRRDESSLLAASLFIFPNLALTSLNFFWFSKMIRSVRARFKVADIHPEE